MDRTKFSVVSLDAPDDQVEYWLTRPAEERIAAITMLRRTFYEDEIRAGLQRVFEVAQLKIASSIF